jgi:hypothetical protein
MNGLLPSNLYKKGKKKNKKREEEKKWYNIVTTTPMLSNWVQIEMGNILKTMQINHNNIYIT